MQCQNLQTYIGATATVQLLRATLRAEQRPSTYLLLGARGAGKRTLAWAYGRGLLCARSQSRGDACGQCPTCVAERPTGWWVWDASALQDLPSAEAAVAEVAASTAERKVCIILAAHLLPRAVQAALYAALPSLSGSVYYIWTALSEAAVLEQYSGGSVVCHVPAMPYQHLYQYIQTLQPTYPPAVVERVALESCASVGCAHRVLRTVQALGTAAYLDLPHPQVLYTQYLAAVLRREHTAAQAAVAALSAIPAAVLVESYQQYVYTLLSVAPTIEQPRTAYERLLYTLQQTRQVVPVVQLLLQEWLLALLRPETITAFLTGLLAVYLQLPGG